MFTLDDSGKVLLKDGNYVNWIDRLDLEGGNVATALYNILAGQTTDAGILANPGNATNLNGDYAILVTQDSGTVSFTYDVNAADPDAAAKAAAEIAVTSANQSNFEKASVYMMAAFDAFDRDYPEVFWLSGQRMCGYGSSYTASYAGGEGTAEYTQPYYFFLTNAGLGFDIRDSAYQTVEAVSAGIARRDIGIANILVSIPKDVSRYEVIKEINSCLTQMNSYNSSADLNSIDNSCRECISALLSGQTGALGPVCEGYARAFKVLCDELEIPCVLVDGFARSSADDDGEAHMWNYVQMEDGNWYAVDVTWNDPVVNGITTTVSGAENEDYLLVGSETVINGLRFIDSHPVSNTVSSTGTAFTNGPVLAAEDYLEAVSARPVSGSCGENATWELDKSTGKLVISGSGEVTSNPWAEYYKDCVYSVSLPVNPPSVTSFPAAAFHQHKNLREISFTGVGGELTKIPENFLNGTSITKLGIPYGVTQIGAYAIMDCKRLESVTLPDTLKTIGPWAFHGCIALTEIVIPASVTKIDFGAFGGCTGLKSITFKGDAPEFHADAFSGVKATVCYPADNPTWAEATKQNYGGEINWFPVYGEIETQFSGSCGENAFWKFEPGTGTLTISGYGEFSEHPWHDKNLQSQIIHVVIKEGITNIPNSAFSGYSNMKRRCVFRLLGIA